MQNVGMLQRSNSQTKLRNSHVLAKAKHAAMSVGHSTEEVARNRVGQLGEALGRLARDPTATIEVLQHHARELEAKLEVQSAVNYIIFLVLFTYVTLSGQRSYHKFMLSANLKSLLGGKALASIRSIDHLYTYIDTTVPSLLFQNTFDGDHGFAQGAHPGSASAQRGDLLGANKV